MAYGELWTQTPRIPLGPLGEARYEPAPPAGPVEPQPRRGFDLGDQLGGQGGLADATLDGRVRAFLEGRLGAPERAAPALAPEVRAQLEREIKDRFQSLSRGGLPLEARPGSKAAEALATGDLGALSAEDLLQLLVALLQYGAQRRDAGSVARQQGAPLAPTGSWGRAGNAYGGGTAQTGANAPAAAAAGPAPAAGPIPNGSPSGVRLAEAARDVANGMNTTGWCYRGAATAIERGAGVSLSGASAYMAAEQLAASPKFKEISVSPDQLGKLPPGAVVVWGRTAASPHGHISVALGNGQEASDHVQTQMTSLRGHQNYRVFVLAEGGAAK